MTGSAGTLLRASCLPQRGARGVGLAEHEANDAAQRAGEIALCGQPQVSGQEVLHEAQVRQQVRRTRLRHEEGQQRRELVRAAAAGAGAAGAAAEAAGTTSGGSAGTAARGKGRGSGHSKRRHCRHSGERQGTARAGNVSAASATSVAVSRTHMAGGCEGAPSRAVRKL